jgi:hypothetical protein
VVSNHRNEALARAIEESGMHPSEVVRGITTERTLARWINKQVRPSPFAARAVARRLKRSHKELFGG